MTKKIIKNLTICLLSIAFVFVLMTQTKAAVYDFATNSGLNTTANVAKYTTTETSTIEDIICTVINIILGLVGVIFMGLVIYGGFTWMTAQGNEENVKKANKILFAALFGLIVTLAAYVISYFLIGYFWA